LRNADLSKGLAGIVEHYRDGVAAVEAALENALPEQGVAARSARMSELKSAGLPEHLARRFANMPALTAAPDVVLVADRTGRPVADVARTYFAARDFFRLDPIADAARTITAVDYFDRLALDRARESLGEGVRRLTAEMVANGKSGRDAVDGWVAARKDEVERIRSAIHEIASSGLTLSKLSVAASLLRDMARD
jgi:glutamate dehydrogenase